MSRLAYRTGSSSALDDVAFLASSPNRVDVLRTLATGAFSRGELHERTGISQPTLGRILEGFAERGWVEKVDRRYRLTRVGSLLKASFEELLGTVETVQRLADLEARLPVEEMPFDFSALTDATVTTPRTPDVLAHVRRVEELVGSADHLRWLTGNVFFEAVARQRALLLTDEQTQEVVIAADALDVLLSRPEMAAIVAELLETGALSVYAYAGSVPYALGVVDDRAVIVPYDDHSVPCAVVDTDDEAVYAWVDDTIDAYRDRATPVTAASLATGPSNEYDTSR